jgi:hypothetical protein
VEHSRELAAWATQHLVVRRDCYGRYYEKDGQLHEVTEKAKLTDAVLLRHFQADRTDDVIGLHTTVFQPDAELKAGGVCLSRWFCTDIDHHGEGPAPEGNLTAALAWHAVLEDRGFHPLLVDSNGRGGYRLYVLFDELILTVHVRQLGRWLIQDWAGLGLTEAPEVFPKQDEITPPGSENGSYGNWLRIPGRHHKRPHWPRVWDGQGWVEGDEAIDRIINTTGDSPRLIPVEVFEFAPEPRQERTGTPRGPRTAEEATEDVQQAREALKCLGKGTKDKLGRVFLEDYGAWLSIGMCLHELGDPGLELWDDWSQQAEASYTDGVCAAKWATFHDAGDHGVTLGTLFYYATLNGWVRPRKRPTSDGRPGFSNCIRVPKDGGKDGEWDYIPRPATEIADYLFKITRKDGTWPKRVDEMMFVEGAGHKPVSLTSATQFFGWLDGRAHVFWMRGPDMVGQERFFEHVRKFRAERFKAIEQFPHWPAMAGAYYMHPPVRPTRSQVLLKEFLDFFQFDSDVDRSLALSAILTPFWGGTPGARPCFRIEGPENDPPELMRRYVGKTTFVEVIASLSEGLIDLEEGEDIPALKTRLLSEEGMSRRVLRVDNLKTLRFSWAALEHFITSDVISGKRLFCGEGQRPNTVTCFITVNGGSFAKDMATRVVVIRLKRPKADGEWRKKVAQFIDANRWGLIAEIMGMLSDETGAIVPRGRWAEWQRGVLGKVAKYAACQDAIELRSAELDDDDDDAEQFEQFVAGKLTDRLHDPAVESVKIPVGTMGQWYSEHEHEDYKSKTVTEKLELKPLKRLKYKRTKGGRFWMWLGPDGEKGAYDLKHDLAPPPNQSYRRQG